MLTPPLGIELSQPFQSLDLAPRRAVLAAVSGGSDSVALLTLLKGHLDRHAPAIRLVAATVDHALRAESASEAAQVARFCATIGVEHLTLRWTGDKPATGLSAAARDSRHRLLAEAAEREGSDLVLTGHTADDQAETVIMRRARSADGDAWYGLAGMAPATLFDGRFWFARPLIAARRQALRSYLVARGTGWIDDPTNADQRHERARVRRRLAAPDGEALVAEALSIASAGAAAREDIGRRVASLVAAYADSPAQGLLRLRPEILADADQEGVLQAFRVLLAVAGGAAHLPDHARAATLLARLAGEGASRRVLSRALVDRRRTGIFILRESRNLPDPAIAPEGGIWDGRYRLVRAEAAPRFARPGANGAPDSLERLAAGGRPAPPRGWSAVPVLAPWARFLPSFDVAAARAVAALIGAPEIPGPPFREHIESKA
ncbi:tRNA lysidine(34) synthetase TilS [Mesorhizobium sp. ZMM04-5]|uniref:tRNA(Ile)-lysidine synthase n=1 Tax=Mesorhizobium marinum TaxID=3228790 RepID=A0ABV3QYG0_9HYPH